MKNGNIVVIDPKDDFKRIHKSIIRNKDIDCFTLGLYTKMVVLGVEWKLSINGLAEAMNISVERVRKAIGTLEKMGYIKRTPTHKNGRLNGWNYAVLPEPLEREDRSHAGCAADSENEIQCYGKFSVTENTVLLKNPNTEPLIVNNNYYQFKPDEPNNDNDINIGNDDIIIKKEKKKEILKKKENEILADYNLADVPKDFIAPIREWCEYKRARGQKYKNQKSFMVMVKRLITLSGNNAQKAQAIVEQSIGNNYAGLFELRQNIHTLGFKLESGRDELYKENAGQNW